MSRLRLTLACWDYDRTRALRDASVQPEGIELDYLSLPVEQSFSRMLKSAEFDVSEMSLSAAVSSLGELAPRFVAIPVFPSRVFRHSSIYVSAAAGTGEGIRSPADLKGLRVGVPHYPMTAAVWIRGLMADEYGLQQGDVDYVVGGLDSPTPMDLPPPPPNLPVRIERAPPGESLASMLARGELAGLYTARIPGNFGTNAGVRRLFRDYRRIEQDHLRRTRIFPIMHTVVIRRDIHERHPWVARSLYDAFDAAKRKSQHELYDTDALRVMLPWLTDEIESMREVLGADWWPYGLQANRQVIDTFLRYHHEQGLSARRHEAADLFVPELRDT